MRLVYLYEKDLKRAMGKLEDMFAENELRDDRIKELEVLVKDLNSAVETAASKVDPFRPTFRRRLVAKLFFYRRSATTIIPLVRGSIILNEVARIMWRERWPELFVRQS